MQGNVFLHVSCTWIMQPARVEWPIDEAPQQCRVGLSVCCSTDWAYCVAANSAPDSQPGK